MIDALQTQICPKGFVRAFITRDVMLFAYNWSNLILKRTQGILFPVQAAKKGA